MEVFLSVRKRLRKRVQVADAALLSKVVQDVAERYATQSKAAAALGIHRGHLNRLVCGHIGASITRDLFERIQFEIPKERMRDLFKALLTPDAMRRLLDYETKLWKELERFDLGPMATVERMAEVTPRYRRFLESGWSPDRPLQITLPGNSAATRTLSAIQQHSSYRALFHDFVETAWQRGHGTIVHGRIVLALSRVVAPIVPTVDGIELSWEELHESNLLAVYLKQALDNESILLKREPFLQRAQRLASMSMSEGATRKRKQRRKSK